MEKRRNRKSYNNNWNNNQKKGDRQQHQNREKESKIKQAPKQQFQFNKAAYEDPEGEKQRIKAIQDVKAREIICPVCNQPISDMASAIADKKTGLPAHFDCILNQIKAGETVGENEKISYIGQGRFAVLYFENPRDQRHFTIKKIIEYEDKEQKAGWRDELSELYSQVK